MLSTSTIASMNKCAEAKRHVTCWQVIAQLKETLAESSARSMMEIDLVDFEAASSAHKVASDQLSACQTTLAATSAENSYLKDRMAALSAEISELKEQTRYQNSDVNETTVGVGLCANGGIATLRAENDVLKVEVQKMKEEKDQVEGGGNASRTQLRPT